MHHKIEIIGHLGKDPEMRYTPVGQPITQFSVATSRKYTNNNGELVQETTWFRINAWGKQGEACNQYLHKGSKVYVEGRLNPDKQTGGPRVYQRQDDSWGAAFEVTAVKVLFLDPRSRNDPEPVSAETSGAEDDIPF